MCVATSGRFLPQDGGSVFPQSIRTHLTPYIVITQKPAIAYLLYVTMKQSTAAWESEKTNNQEINKGTNKHRTSLWSAQYFPVLQCKYDSIWCSMRSHGKGWRQSARCWKFPAPPCIPRSLTDLHSWRHRLYRSAAPGPLAGNPENDAVYSHSFMRSWLSLRYQIYSLDCMQPEHCYSVQNSLKVDTILW